MAARIFWPPSIVESLVSTSKTTGLAVRLPNEALMATSQLIGKVTEKSVETSDDVGVLSVLLYVAVILVVAPFPVYLPTDSPP